MPMPPAVIASNSRVTSARNCSGGTGSEVSRVVSVVAVVKGAPRVRTTPLYNADNRRRLCGHIPLRRTGCTPQRGLSARYWPSVLSRAAKKLRGELRPGIQQFDADNSAIAFVVKYDIRSDFSALQDLCFRKAVGIMTASA